MKHSSSILAVFSALCFTDTSLHAEVRTFTSSAGTTLKGELVSVNGDTVTIKKEDGQTLTLKATAFSRVDQAWLETQGIKTAASSATPSVKKPDTKLKITKPLKVTVKNSNGVLLDRYAWKGQHAALLTISDSLDLAVVASALSIMDRVYEFYTQTTGHEPAFEFPEIKRAVTIEDEGLSPTIRGGSATALINIRPDILRDLLRDLSNPATPCSENTSLWFVFYGLHSWPYKPKLGSNPQGFAAALLYGNAESMALQVARSLGIQLSTTRSKNNRDRETVVEAQLDAYIKDTSLNFQTTLGVNKSPEKAKAAPGTRTGDVSEFAASFILRLCRDHGGADYNTRLWHELDKRPDAKTDQDGVDNFILAACAAADKDLSNLFTTQWRWPMSVRAVAEAKKRWKKP